MTGAAMTPRRHSKRPFRRRKNVRKSLLNRLLHVGAYVLVFALAGWYLKSASQGSFWPFQTSVSNEANALGRDGGELQGKIDDLGSEGFRILENQESEVGSQLSRLFKKVPEGVGGGGGDAKGEAEAEAVQIEDALIQRVNEREKNRVEEQLSASNTAFADTSDEADNGVWEGDSVAANRSTVESQLGQKGSKKGGFRRSFQFPMLRHRKAPGLVSRIGFGSCTARMKLPQPIWEQAVIPSEPDAWIWAGDLAYLDWPDVDCRVNPDHQNCNCEKDWLKSSYQSCLSGDMTHARAKLQEQLEHPDYVKFLQYMCPTWQPQGLRGPDGLDSVTCPRTILGTWDDHDYNWQDGNRRLPRKEAQKQLYLDALGVPQDDARRQVGRGLYAKHTLNRGVAGKEIDVFLLDGRYFRDPKPCALRREFCEKMVLTSPKKDKFAWCQDFLHGGKNDSGSCCKRDEELYDGWCRLESSRSDLLWATACDPTSSTYGQVQARLEWNARLERMALVRVDARSRWWGEEEDEDASVMCEVLGHEQRLWLTTELRASRSPLKLIVVGSPIFNNPSKTPCKGKTPKGLGASVACPCFDDFDCYRPAQVALLHALARAPGCPVIITGDFHFSDLKVLRPGKNLYSSEYLSEDFGKTIYQMMASGMTTDTAKIATCQGFHRDRMGLRFPGECDFVSGPAFGVIEVDWEGGVVSLQIRDGSKGEVQVETSFHHGSCTERVDVRRT